MNEDYTLTTFAEPITALADDPQLPPDEMKRRLQAPADELLEAHNALARTVKGITDATYPDTVTREMLTQDVRDELDGKADAADVTAETQSLDTRLGIVETALPLKCECYFGVYSGNGTASRTITLGFKPKAVLVMQRTGNTCLQYNGTYCYGGLALQNYPVIANEHEAVTITENGFQIAYDADYRIYTNMNNTKFCYLALF